jgi:hypothetical protein
MSNGNAWFKIPCSFIDALPTFESLGALKVELVMRKLDHEGLLDDEKNAPSLTDLGELAGMDRGNVARAIRQLLSAGRIELSQRGKSAGNPSRYRIKRSVPGATVGSVSGATVSDPPEGLSNVVSSVVSQAQRSGSTAVSGATVGSVSGATRLDRELYNTSAARTDGQKADSKNSTNGRKTHTEIHAQFIDGFCRRWREKYDTDFPFAAAGGKNGAHVKAIIKAVNGDRAKLKGILDRYFECNDPFILKNRHSLGLLLSKLEMFVVDQPAVDGNGFIPIPLDAIEIEHLQGKLVAQNA